MNELHRKGKIAWQLVRNYPIAALGGWRYQDVFADVETYCMFIGYSRSGKTMIASLLDAHPNLIIADELDALQYIYAGFSARQIYYLLLENARTFAKAGRISRGYSYKIPNQWQGRFKKLRVIGDNDGEGATLRLHATPWLLQKLHNTIGINIKFIHVIRNPYDNISALLTRRDISLNLESSIEHYFSLCEIVEDIKKQIKGDDLFELRHESLINSPTTCLKELCHFLGVKVSDDYLNDSVGILFKSPHKHRYEAPWNRELIEIVKNRIGKVPFLHGYSYEN